MDLKLYKEREEKDPILLNFINGVRNNESYMALAKEKGVTEKVTTTLDLLKTYGEINGEPLYYARDICVIMNSSLDNVKKYDEGVDFIYGYIISKTGREKKVTLLTIKGAIRLVYSAKNALAKALRDIFCAMIKSYITDEEKYTIILNKSIARDPELYGEACSELHQNIEKLALLYQEERTRNRELMEQNRNLAEDISQTENGLFLLNYTNDLLEERVRSMDMSSSIDNSLYDMIVSHYMKDLYIYPLHFTEAEKRIKNIDFGTYKMEYEFAEKYGLNVDSYLIYSIGMGKKKKESSLCWKERVHSRKNVENIRNKLREFEISSSNKKETYYRCSLDSIKCVVLEEYYVLPSKNVEEDAQN